MLIADWKSGGLRDNHEQEVMFHAVLAALRHGVPPFRTTVYSLASGTITQPDLTPRRCRQPSTTSRPGVRAFADVLTDRRPLEVMCGMSWCKYGQRTHRPVLR